MIPMVRRLAFGMSSATKSIPASRRYGAKGWPPFCYGKGPESLLASATPNHDTYIGPVVFHKSAKPLSVELPP
jgi:hypothetical protein